MKKLITKSLLVIFAAGMLVTLALNFYLQIFLDTKAFRETASDNFWQIEQIIKENEKELKKIKEDFAEDCIVRARAAAYIAQHYPAVIEDMEECKLVASLLQVDELHFFTTDGEIYAGTHPEYYGYNFSSGEQMAFFAPMLKDHSLELCQDITPNTAEKKLMQYAAVWRQDGKGIMQVGLEPERVLKAIEGNNISEIFTMISADTSSAFYAVDTESGRILGSTEKNKTDKDAKAIGLNPKKITEEVSWDRILLDGQRQYYAAKRADDLILVKTVPVRVLHDDVIRNTLLLCVYLFLVFMLLLAASYMFLERKIIRSIVNINENLKEIEEGNWDTVLSENSTEEFAELSRYINNMVERLLGFSRKIAMERDTDILTGLHNRRAFYRCAEELFKAPEALKNGLIVMIDMDKLKMVNDLYGHADGDRYLKAMAGVLKDCDAENKLAARMGGDEFLLFVYNYTEEEVPGRITEWLQASRGREGFCTENGNEVILEFSMGCAKYPEEGRDYQKLIKLADKRMYADKKKRHDRQAGRG